MWKPSRRSAVASVVFAPRSAFVNRRVGGRVSTWTTRKCERPSQRRIAVLADGTANAAAIATAKRASGITSVRRHGTARSTRASMRARTRGARSGSAGQSTRRLTANNSRSSSAIVSSKLLSETTERARDARLDRAAPDPERCRGFLLGQVEEVHARDHEPVVFGQGLDRRHHLVATLRGESGILGGRDRAPRALLPGSAQRQARTAPGQAPPVVRLVRHDPKQPGPKRLAAPKATDRAERLHERVLGCLLGVGRRTGDQVGRAEGDSLVSV